MKITLFANWMEDISKETNHSISHLYFSYMIFNKMIRQMFKNSFDYNHTNLFTKILSTSTIEKLRHKIGMSLLWDIK